MDDPGYDREIDAIQQRLLENLVLSLTRKGHSAEEANRLAIEILNRPLAVPLPTFEELG